MRFYTILLVLLIFGCTVENPPTSNETTTTTNGTKTVNGEENIEEQNGNHSALKLDKKMTTLLDGTTALNLTCSITKKHQAVITNVLSFGWKWKPPTGDEDFGLIMEINQGEFIWGEGSSWKKFSNVKENGRAYGQLGEASSAFTTIHIPVLPPENDGIFQCFMVAETNTGERKEWSSFYKDNSNVLVDILSDMDGLTLKLAITVAVLLVIQFFMAVILCYLEKKRNKPGTQGSKDKKEDIERQSKTKTDMESPLSDHRSRIESTSSIPGKRSLSRHHSRKSSHSAKDKVYSGEKEGSDLQWNTDIGSPSSKHRMDSATPMQEQRSLIHSRSHRKSSHGRMEDFYSDKNEDRDLQWNTDMGSPSSKHRMGSSTPMQEQRSRIHSRSHRKSSHGRMEDFYSDKKGDKDLHWNTDMGSPSSKIRPRMSSASPVQGKRSRLHSRSHRKSSHGRMQDVYSDKKEDMDSQRLTDHNSRIETASSIQKKRPRSSRHLSTNRKSSHGRKDNMFSHERARSHGNAPLPPPMVGIPDPVY